MPPLLAMEAPSVTCDCNPTLIRASASPWTCPHGNVWRLGVPGDPYCWTLEPSLDARRQRIIQWLIRVNNVIRTGGLSLRKQAHRDHS